jgi:hypothetical protein
VLVVFSQIEHRQYSIVAVAVALNPSGTIA